MTGVETTTVDGISERISFEYDAIGRRHSKTSSERTTTFRWSGSNLIAEYDGENLTCTYRYDQGFSAAEYSDTDDSWYLTHDYLDTPRNLLDDSGNASPLDITDPFGALITPAAASPTFNQRFPGQYADRETGLNYNLNRYYDPSTGRYTRDDPSGLAGGLNAYAYGGSSPTTRVDQLGLRNYFITIEGELVHVIGIEGGFGIVFDFDAILQSGIFFNSGIAYGLSAGIGVGGGACF